ncbi:tyrosine-protein phosphatase [Ilumatobacter sp.]|uniref:tyrosine-protein phosphatase n=1 Tax=Ilumatobacter sp. TaxID=1967498 RepID=UPI003B52ACD2
MVELDVREMESTAAVDDPRRLIELTAVHNFRDLGGYRMGDGRTIGWGRLFRADGLYRLTSTDLDTLDALGIRTVVDLRSSGELDDHGHFPFEGLPVAFHHLAIMDATWKADEMLQVEDTEQGSIDFLTWAYLQMLDDAADRFAAAFGLLAVPGAVPAVFHCAAGKDRTGLLAALILGGLGVDSEVIVADYALTQAAMVRMRRWVEGNRPELAHRMGETPAFMLAAHPEALRRVIAELVERHGSIRRYLSSIGVGSALIAEMAEAVTD